MTYKIILVLALFLSFGFSTTKWTPKQIEAANTAVNAQYLTDSEKEVVKYINLARLYPGLFYENELSDYYGTPKYGDYLRNSRYRKSLIEDLETAKPLPALYLDQKMSKSAKCFAVDQGKRGYVGHTRQRCMRTSKGECCSYGMSKGRDVAMQLLIDHDVPSVGHRKILFFNEITKIGVGESTHKLHDNCCVIEVD